MAQTQQELSKALKAFLEKLKSKPIRDYPLAELQLILDVVHVFYTKTTLKEEKRTLKDVYCKIVEWYHSVGPKIYNLELK